MYGVRNLEHHHQEKWDDRRWKHQKQREKRPVLGREVCNVYMCEKCTSPSHFTKSTRPYKGAHFTYAVRPTKTCCIYPLKLWGCHLYVPGTYSSSDESNLRKGKRRVRCANTKRAMWRTTIVDSNVRVHRTSHTLTIGGILRLS